MSDNKAVDPLEDTRAESIRPGKLLAGAPIGGYELQHVLGEGGMGVVWCAHDPLLDRTIAIKVLKSRDVAAAMRTRLLREAQAMAQIKHPNVLTVHRVGTEHDRDFIVMELVDGGPLDHWLAFGPPTVEVMEALLAAGRGLAAAHAAGLVHRDFKPNNVLRSKDGRVLVTDFGLARGLGEDGAAPAGEPGVAARDSAGSLRSPSSRDNVLDAALTKTGALIGTPAYMAPEQFAGAEPDPRTDQFAFCITVWQALTGARPFHGRTLDELRQAVAQGVGAVIAELPRPMRAVLTRGLDPDPAKRWPDMPALLRELERAGRPRRPRWPWIAGGAALAITGAVIAYAATRPAAEPPCPPAAVAWADAWTGDRALPWLAAVLDDRQRRWTAAYEQTCKATTARPEGRLACLRVVRDRIAAVAALARDPAARAALDPFSLLVPDEACSNGKLVLAALPAEPTAALAVLTRSAGAPTTAGLAEQAARSGWAPATTFVAVAAGLDQVQRGELDAGRAALERVVSAAEGVDVRLAAQARLGLLEASVRELARPDLPGKADLHDELVQALTWARGAVKAAGNEPELAGRLVLFEAEVLAGQAERSRKGSMAEAAQRALDGYHKFQLAGDLRRAARAAELHAELQLRRGDRDLLDDADHVARSAIDALIAVELAVPPSLEHVLGRIAFARGELAVAHRWFDRHPASTPASGATISGVVLGPDRKPLMNAVVIAWTGELLGDPLRAVTDRGTLEGELVETGAEGRFTIHARPGAWILAESAGGTLRSRPVAARLEGGAQTLQLETTSAFAGSLDLDGGAPEVYARVGGPQAAWLVRVPITKTGAFQLTNLPHGTWELGALGASGTGVRRARGATVTLTAQPPPWISTVAWVTGRPLDVVVRGPVEPGATVWIGEARALAGLTTRRAIEAWSATAIEVAWSPLDRIGARYTDAGRPAYAAGAHHAVLVGDFTQAAACVAPSADPDAKLACKPIEPGAAALAIDL